MTPAGNGRTHALKNTSVLAVGKHWGSFGDGMIDMSGKGAELTYFSRNINICLVADTDEEFDGLTQIIAYVFCPGFKSSTKI